MPFAIIGLILLVGLSGGLMSTQPPTTQAVQTQPLSGIAATLPASAERQVSNTSYAPIPTNSVQPTAVVDKETDTRSPRAKTIAAQNIEYNRVLLRGDVNMYAQTGRVFFVYGYNQKKVTAAVNQSKTYDTIPDYVGTEAKTILVTKTAKDVKSYTKTINSLSEDTVYYYTICVESDTTSKFTCGIINSFRTTERYPRSNNFRTPYATTDSVSNINAYDATIKGRFNINDADEGTAFFVYGESSTEVAAVPTQYGSYSDVDENDELLQKIRLGTYLKGNGTYERVIDDLDRGTKYYYRMCLEYDGDRTGLVCGGLRYFTTDERDKSDIPKVFTTSMQAIGKTATARASVNMNDYNDGRVFLLYGTDKQRLEKITDTYAFNRITQAKDVLQKLSIDNDFDGSATVTKTVKDLLPLTQYYYKMCVEYEAENDKGNDTLYLSCSPLSAFITGS